MWAGCVLVLSDLPVFSPLLTSDVWPLTSGELTGKVALESEWGSRYDSNVATITLRNIPEHLHESLKARAVAHGRSLDSEALECLERALVGKPLDAAAFLDRVRRLRASTPGQISDALILQARQTGRP